MDEAIRISSHKPNSVVVFQRKQCRAELHITSPKDYNWTDLIEKVQKEGKTSVACEEMKSTDELYLLYTSGTTGKPKGLYVPKLVTDTQESFENPAEMPFNLRSQCNSSSTSNPTKSSSAHLT